MQPRGYSVKGGAAGDVVDEQGTRGTAEIGARDRFVRFLTGGVPEGEFHALLIWGLVGGLGVGRGLAGSTGRGGFGGKDGF